MKTHEPKTIMEAITQLQVFLECDLWYASKEEWVNEDDMIRYLDGHFMILKQQVIKLLKEKP